MSATPSLRIGTRGSALALAQARIAAQALAGSVRGAEVVVIPTRGDAISARRPSGGWVATDGQFTGELERALLDRRIDVAVHSYKDLPTSSLDGLVIGAVLERADARDCLITPDGAGLDELPFGARVGTSSTRRAAQLAAARRDLIAVPMRGNVETRLQRVRNGGLDAIVLAAAGLDRLGVEVAEGARLPFEVMLPAPAQGALALQVRADDVRVVEILAAHDHAATRVAVEAERNLLRRLGGGCLAPLGALGTVTDDTLRLRAAYEDGAGELTRADGSGPVDSADAVVATVADEITRAAAVT